MLKRFISAKIQYSVFIIVALAAIGFTILLLAKKQYEAVDFGKSFGTKATVAKDRLKQMQFLFESCATVCNSDTRFMKAIVFPELMRYHNLKDGIEAESLRVLYVQFGKEYANFSIGLFQMKPSFAEQVEKKSADLLPLAIQKELQLTYNLNSEEEIRRQRVERLQDEEWQLVYLTAFIAICNELYKAKTFRNNFEKLQWFATVYNAGFDRTDTYILKKMQQALFYLKQGMPEKKYKYAAIAGWYYLNN